MDGLRERLSEIPIPGRVHPVLEAARALENRACVVAEYRQQTTNMKSRVAILRSSSLDVEVEAGSAISTART
jgi:hypothetical protein